MSSNFLKNQSQYAIDIQLDKLYNKYHSEEKTEKGIDNNEPNIVLSETIY